MSRRRSAPCRTNSAGSILENSNLVRSPANDQGKRRTRNSFSLPSPDRLANLASVCTSRTVAWDVALSEHASQLLSQLRYGALMGREALPLLSICIPTFNRAAFIGETLESIVQQAVPEIEVVVSDNASADNTAEIVESFRDRLPRLLYSRTDTNEGYAANFFRAARLATGEYAWLLGSDDVVRPGLVDRALRELQSGAIVYIFDRIECDLHLAPIRVDLVLGGPGGDDDFTPANRGSLLHYMRRSRSIAALFAFTSSVIFRRSTWEAVEIKREWLGCSFPHAIRLWDALLRQGTLKYVNESLVLARLDNDTFNPDSKHTIRRLMMNYQGYQMIRNAFWQRDRPVRNALEAVMRRTHPRTDLLKLRRLVTDDEIEELSFFLEDFGYGHAFARFYRTDQCRQLVVLLKRLYVRLGLSPSLTST
jgi:abequosyltransferase